MINNYEPKYSRVALRGNDQYLVISTSPTNKKNCAKYCYFNRLLCDVGGSDHVIGTSQSAEKFHNVSSVVDILCRVADQWLGKESEKKSSIFFSFFPGIITATNIDINP